MYIQYKINYVAVLLYWCWGWVIQYTTLDCEEVISTKRLNFLQMCLSSQPHRGSLPLPHSLLSAAYNACWYSLFLMWEGLLKLAEQIFFKQARSSMEPPSRTKLHAKEACVARYSRHFGDLVHEKPAPPTQPSYLMYMTHSSGMTLHTCTEHQRHRIDFGHVLTVKYCVPAFNLCVYKCMVILLLLYHLPLNKTTIMWPKGLV